MVGVQAPVYSGDGHAWPLIAWWSEGSGVETGVGMEMKTSGSGTSVVLVKLDQTKAERVGQADAEHPRRDA